MVPSVTPTVAVSDCSVKCTIRGSNWAPVTMGNSLGLVQLPRYFELKFSVYDLSVGTAPKNIISIVHAQTNSMLFGLYMTEYISAPNVVYNDIVVGSYIELFSFTAWDVVNVTIKVRAYEMSSFSSVAGITTMDDYVNVDTTSQTYAIYASNPSDDTSGGFISNIEIKGMGFFLYCIPIYNLYELLTSVFFMYI